MILATRWTFPSSAAERRATQEPAACVRPGDARRRSELTTRKESLFMSPRRTRQQRSSVTPPSPPQARARGRILHSATVGALPILNRFLDRMRLEEFLRAALPAGRPPHETLAGQGPVALGAKRAGLARADLRHGRVGRAARPRSVGPDAARDRAAERRPRGPGLGQAVCRRRAVAGPGRGPHVVREFGVQPGRTAQRLDHRLLLRRLLRRPPRSDVSSAAPPWRSPSATTRTIAPT